MNEEIEQINFSTALFSHFIEQSQSSTNKIQQKRKKKT